jgi:hypothetical protein
MDVHCSTIERDSNETGVINRIHLGVNNVSVLQLTVGQALRIVRDSTRESVVTLRKDLAMVTDSNRANLSGGIL